MPPQLILLGALIATWAGCTSLYLASPNQRWRHTPWPARPARVLGATLLLVGLIGFGQAMLPLTAVFTFVTSLMLGLALLPYLGALRKLQGGR